MNDVLAGYGFFHVAGKPNKLWGMVTTGFTVNGIMADIGHVRHMRWVQDDSPTSAINQPPTGSTQKAEEIAKARWISYNRMRGQYASALEHATPEQFFVDKSQCGKTGQPVCQQAISAVKALQIAAAEGQKIYTITQASINSALPRITAGKYVFEEIQNAVAAGKEVTIHERPIHAFGWSGSGYAVVDPETGAGAYMIEGGANGAFFAGLGLGVAAVALTVGLGLAIPALVAATGFAAWIAVMQIMIIAVLWIAEVALFYSLRNDYQDQSSCFQEGIGLGAALAGIIPAGESLKAFLIALVGTVLIGYAQETVSKVKQCVGG